MPSLLAPGGQKGYVNVYRRDNGSWQKYQGQDGWKPVAGGAEKQTAAGAEEKY